VHAIREQLASCAVAEALDDIIVRPQTIYWLTWWVRHLPGGLIWGFLVGKAAADAVYYAVEAAARCGAGATALRLRSRLRGWRAPVPGDAAARP
jgi:hypothetical protein